MLKRSIQPEFFGVCLFMLLALGATLRAAEKSQPEPPPKPVTTGEPTIPVDELELMVEPLTADELVVEADAWLALLKAKVAEVSKAEIAIKRKNRAIEQAEEIKDSVGEAKEALKEVKNSTVTAQTVRSPEAAEDATKAAKEAQKAVDKVADTVQKAAKETAAAAPGGKDDKLGAALDKAAKGAREAREGARKVTREVQGTGGRAEGQQQKNASAAIEQTQEALDKVGGEVKEAARVASREGTVAAGHSKLAQAEKAAERVAESKAEEKSAILDVTTELREERTGLIDRLNVVLDELNSKLAKTPTDADNEKVLPYRLYAQSVSGLKVDISDTEAAYVSLLGWLKSEEGGIRWAKNLGIFLATVLIFWLLGILLGKLVERALRLSQQTSVLLRNFAAGAVRYIVIIVGIIIGLSALEVNIGPLLAVVGAAGFVIAFALQNTLSNFASGLMIMFYKPFDVGNVISVSGLVGVVRSMNLVNTKITTFDNQVMIVPNNSIWGNTITNITGSEERRVDLVFGIGYRDDINLAQQILEEIVNDHPLVLDEPKPMIRLDELAESSVNFICRPWTKTSNWGQVRWDITRAVKERFDEAGITIPFPQRDVYVYNADVPAESDRRDG
ncbi:MAG: mechanosensitive ion channel domain-containing protein, partial [Candidatus Binatia bacterium]